MEYYTSKTDIIRNKNWSKNWVICSFFFVFALSLGAGSSHTVNNLAEDRFKYRKHKLLLSNSKILSVKISVMKLDNFYHLEYSDYWPHLYCYTHNVLADISFSLLQVFHVKLRSQHKTLNWILYLIHRGRLFQLCKTMTGY